MICFFYIMFIVGIFAALVDALKTSPQVYKSYTSKNTRDLSWHTILLSSLSGFLWFIYGWSESDLPILVSASFYFLSNMLLVYVKRSHDERSRASIETLDQASSTDD